MVHLSNEILSDLIDGSAVEGAEQHLSTCLACRSQLRTLRELRERLQALPELEAPGHLWGVIERQIAAEPAGGGVRWPRRVVLQAAAIAAVFVIGLGLGARFLGDGSAPTAVAIEDEAPVEFVSAEPGSVANAIADVERRGLEYDAALRRLEEVARRTGEPMPTATLERLAALDVLIESARTALAADPADPALNSYLFAALEERENVRAELERRVLTGSEVAWR